MSNDEVSQQSNVAQLVPTRPDQQVVNDLDKRFREALKPVCALMDEALSHGFLVELGLLPVMPYNHFQVTKLAFIKHYIGTP